MACKVCRDARRGEIEHAARHKPLRQVEQDFGVCFSTVRRHMKVCVGRSNVVRLKDAPKAKAKGKAAPQATLPSPVIGSGRVDARFLNGQSLVAVVERLAQLEETVREARDGVEDAEVGREKQSAIRTVILADLAVLKYIQAIAKLGGLDRPEFEIPADVTIDGVREMVTRLQAELEEAGNG